MNKQKELPDEAQTIHETENPPYEIDQSIEVFARLIVDYIINNKLLFNDEE